MFPELFSIGGVTLYTYGVVLALAFIVALWLAGRQAAKAGLNSAHVADLGIWTLLAGLVGARLMLLAMDWSYYTRHPAELYSLARSGGVFYGGLLAALPVALWLIRRYKLPLWPTLDVLAPAVVLAQAIGRLGCLAAGCCFGAPCDYAWAVTFTRPSLTRTVGTPIDVPLHPAQIYESLAALAIFFLLLWMASRKRFHGQVFLTYLATYAAARFVIEYFRGDPRGAVACSRLRRSSVSWSCWASRFWRHGSGNGSASSWRSRAASLRRRTRACLPSSPSSSATLTRARAWTSG
jgi:phosphatidylglycerol:prolipoprotein diacylglycerol transferase